MSPIFVVCVLDSLCCGPRFDPEFVAIKMTFLDARAFLRKSEAAEVLKAALNAAARPPEPVGVLLARAGHLGWQWLPEVELFRDSIGSFCLWEVSSQELDFRLSIAWQGRVASMVSHREDFEELANIDPVLTRRLVRSCGFQGAALMQVALNGTSLLMGCSLPVSTVANVIVLTTGSGSALPFRLQGLRFAVLECLHCRVRLSARRSMDGPCGRVTSAGCGNCLLTSALPACGLSASLRPLH